HQRQSRDDHAQQVQGIHRLAIEKRHRCPLFHRTRTGPHSRGQSASTRLAGLGARSRFFAYCTACTRLIMSAYFGPYLSHTGLTASWNGFLSAISVIVMPAAFALSIASFSYLAHSTRSSCCASRPNFTSSA